MKKAAAASAPASDDPFAAWDRAVSEQDARNKAEQERKAAREAQIRADRAKRVITQLVKSALYIIYCFIALVSKSLDLLEQLYCMFRHYRQNNKESYKHGYKAECNCLIDSHFDSPYSLLDNLIDHLAGNLCAYGRYTGCHSRYS